MAQVGRVKVCLDVKVGMRRRVMLLLATMASGNITTESNEKFVDSGELFRGANVKRDGTRIKIGRELGKTLVSDVVETFRHTRVI
jgi:hypothetical protein